MKPLTIEQLRSLEVGDWVWVIDCGFGCYVQIIDNTNDFVFQVAPESDYLRYEDYGEQWVAYKNKEHAECKGEIMELPCIRERIPSNPNKSPFVVNFVKENGFIDGYAEWSREEAERRLAELTKE